MSCISCLRSCFYMNFLTWKFPSSSSSSSSNKVSSVQNQSRALLCSGRPTGGHGGQWVRRGGCWGEGSDLPALAEADVAGVVQCGAWGICDLSSQVCLMLGELSGILLWAITGTFKVFPVLWRSHLPHSKCLAVSLNFKFLMVLVDCNWSYSELIQLKHLLWVLLVDGWQTRLNWCFTPRELIRRLSFHI